MEFARFAEAVGLQLEPFQRRIATAAAGPERELVVLIPRGSGKTTLDAALALHHLIEREGAEVYVAASSRAQASILFEAVPELAFRRFHCNQWTERAGYWLPPGAWQACVGEPVFTAGEPVWVGVDVGGDKSASAVVWINESYQMGVEIFHGDEGVLDCVDKVRELAGTYQVREVVYDPWRFGQAAQELEAERIVVTQFPQTDARMIPSSDRLYRAIIEKRLVVPDDDELRTHAANTVARHNRRGWRLDKPSLDTPNDSIIALCMALEALENQPEPVQVVGWL